MTPTQRDLVLKLLEISSTNLIHMYLLKGEMMNVEDDLLELMRTELKLREREN